MENEVCGFWNILNNNPGAKHHIDKRILIGTMQKKYLHSNYKPMGKVY